MARGAIRGIPRESKKGMVESAGIALDSTRGSMGIPTETKRIQKGTPEERKMAVRRDGKLEKVEN